MVEGAIEATRPHLVLTCAAIGDHVDHCLTRDAVLVAARGKDIRLRLWQDIPYAVWHGSSLEAVAPGAGAPELVETPDDRAWRAKHQAVAAYVSQLRMLWPDSDFRDDLDRHARSLGGARRGELFWVMPGRSAIPAPRAVVPGVCCHFDPDIR